MVVTLPGNLISPGIPMNLEWSSQYQRTMLCTCGRGQRTFMMMKNLKEAWIRKDSGLRYVYMSCDSRLPFSSSQRWDWFNTGFVTQTLCSYPSIIGTINNAISPNWECLLNINWGSWFSKTTDLYLNFPQEFSSNKDLEYKYYRI